MSNQDPNLSKDSTIYSYTLMKRMHHSLYRVFFYLLVLVSVLFYLFEPTNWLPVLVSYPLLILAHTLLVRIYFQSTIGSAMRGWSFKWGFFWCGTLPAGHASIRLVNKVHQHLFWIGLASIAVLYPWITETWLIHLTVFHLWMLMPRLWILFRFRPFRKRGLIKITSKDTSCYMQ